MKTDSTRIAKPADAAKITAVINAAFRIAEEFFLDEDRITQTEVEELLGKGAFLLAETDDQLDGCVYVELRGERSYLGLLSVDPDRQQGGLGSLLMNAHSCGVCVPIGYTSNSDPRSANSPGALTWWTDA